MSLITRLLNMNLWRWNPRASWLAFLLTLGFVWFGAVLFAWSAMLQHTYRQNATDSPVTHWPKSTRVADSSGPRILIFAHPLCPCTQATLDMLDESLTRLPEDTSLHLIFCTAGLDASQVAASRSRQFAGRIRQANVMDDPDGNEARRFGATVSGEVFVFNANGDRVFHGGITPGRGHRGESAGQQQLERLVLGQLQQSCTAPVYGCSLPRPAHFDSIR